MGRGQIALEFSLMVMLAFLFFTVILVIGTNFLLHAQEQRCFAALQDEANALQQELLLASSVHDGYRRTLDVPSTLAGRSYVIDMSGTVLTLSVSDGFAYSRDIPATTGVFTPGKENIIEKRGGSITVSS